MKVAVIGLGVISANHIEAILASGQEIVALCDVVKEKCENVIKSRSLTGVQVYTNYKEMLDSEEIDCVHICTPHYLHAEMVVYALNKNVNVFCEKPIAISKEQLAEIEKAVKSSTAQLGVCLQNRYNQSTKYVLDLIKDSKVVAASGLMAWGRGEKYYKSAEWRGKWATEGGGVMINQALHTLDLLMLFTDFPNYCTAHLSNNSLKDVIEVEDTAFGMFDFDDGRRFIINATNAALSTFSVQFSLATKDYLIYMAGENVIVNGKLAEIKPPEVKLGKECWGVGHFLIIEDFYKKLQNGERFEIDFYEARKVVDLILAMYSSNGEKIKL